MSESNFGAIFAFTQKSDLRFRSYFAKKGFGNVFLIKILSSSQPTVDWTTQFCQKRPTERNTLLELVNLAKIKKSQILRVHV